MNNKSLLILIAILLTLSACSSNSMDDQNFTEVAGYPSPPQASSISTSYPSPTLFRMVSPEDLVENIPIPPTPKKGKASLSGVLYSYTINSIIPGTGFYLSQGEGENKDQPPTMLVGPQEKRGDISATTDENGFLILNNIEPGKYYLIVWAPLNWSFVEIDGTNQNPLLIDISADEKYKIGVAFVSWP